MTVRNSLCCRLSCFIGALFLLPFNPALSAAQEPPSYTVIEGRVDTTTMNGYRRFHSVCQVCHGHDGVGTNYAPDLTLSLKVMSYGDFRNVVENGRVIDTPERKAIMPLFSQSREVMDHLDDIYSYLKARSDGVLGRGRPRRIQ